MNFGEFKAKYPKCPYCGGSNFKSWTHLNGSALEYICDDCWSGDFGWQMHFTTKDNLIDDNAPPFMFRVWNGKDEVWFYFANSPYFPTLNEDYFNVLIVQQGPMSDNPVEGRLIKRFRTPKNEFDQLLGSKEYILKWIDEALKYTVAPH